MMNGERPGVLLPEAGTGPAAWPDEADDVVVFGALAAISSTTALDAALGGGSAGVALP